MPSLNHKLLDLYDDVELAGITKIASTASIPDSVKGMQLLSNDELEKLADEDFALVEIEKTSKVRRFPVNDYGNAWMSAKYFEQTYSNLDYSLAKIAAKRLAEACDFYDIKEVPSVISNFPEAVITPITKTASKYALGNRYPLEDELDVKKACTYFEKYASAFTPSERHQYSKAVQSRAKELNVVVDNSTLQKYASTQKNEAFSAYVNERKTMVSDDVKRSVLDKIASIFVTESDIEKVAKMLEQFDKDNGLETHWDTHIRDPYSASFTMEKKACNQLIAGDESISEVELIEGIEKERIKFKEYFGNEVVTQMEKFPTDIFESLPNPTKEVVINLVKGRL